MTTLENGTNGSRYRVVLGRDARSARRSIKAAADDLYRLETLMLEMLRGGMAPESSNLESIQIESARRAGQADPPAGNLSRQMLDQLARDQGKAPLHGLRLAGDPTAPPLYLRIDRHLRLLFDSGSNHVGIERRTRAGWRRLDLTARKDGRGGLWLDLAAFARQAAPLAPKLRQLLRILPSS